MCVYASWGCSLGLTCPPRGEAEGVLDLELPAQSPPSIKIQKALELSAPRLRSLTWSLRPPSNRAPKGR